MATRAEAKLAGEALAARMGPGWVVHTWSNISWYAEVTKGVASVRPDLGGYRAEIRLDESIRTDVGVGICVQFFGEDPDPQKALQKAIRRANNGISQIRRTLMTLDKEIDALQIPPLSV